MAHSFLRMAGWWWRSDHRDGREARAAAQVICVSHTGRENTELRACLPPGRAAVIPNAVHAAHFAPAELRALLRHAGLRDGQPAPPAGCGASRPGAALPRGGAMTPGQPVRGGPEAHNEQDANTPGVGCQLGLPGAAPAPRAWPGRERSPEEATVVCLSRLVHRKGIDLLALVVPEACRRRPGLRFVIGALAALFPEARMDARCSCLHKV